MHIYVYIYAYIYIFIYIYICNALLSLVQRWAHTQGMTQTHVFHYMTLFNLAIIV